MITAKTKKLAVVWTEVLRLRVNDVVVQEGIYYQNTSGINSDPATDVDFDNWNVIGFTPSSPYNHDTTGVSSQLIVKPINVVVESVYYNRTKLLETEYVASTDNVEILYDTVTPDVVITITGQRRNN